MGAPFYNWDDVRMNLHNSVCMYRGEPVYVQVAGDEVRVAKVGTDRWGKADYLSSEFDYCAMRMGYMNYKEDAFFLSRLPDRRNNQGLTLALIHSQPRLPNNYWWSNPCFGDALMGRYPNRDQALEDVNSGRYESCAFNRQFAFRRHGDRHTTLMFRNRMIAIKDYSAMRFDMIPGKDTSFIRRVMDREGVTL